MVGASVVPMGAFNEAYNKLVFVDNPKKKVDKGGPLAWREPLQDNGGFRVLLPHQAAKSNAQYVSAIRVDVFHRTSVRRLTL